MTWHDLFIYSLTYANTNTKQHHLSENHTIVIRDPLRGRKKSSKVSKVLKFKSHNLNACLELTVLGP